MKAIEWAQKHVIIVLSIIVLAGTALHLTTVAFSPVHWMDEIQIAEIAHGGIGSKDHEGSMCMLCPDGSGSDRAWAIYWLGGWFHDVGYNMMGHCGPRIVQLAWLVGLTFLVFSFSRLKTHDKLFSLLMSLCVFAYPILSQSVRGGRVDVQSFFFIMLSLCALAWSQKIKRGFYLIVGIVGMSCALASFSWITSLLLLPLVVNELVCTLKARNAGLKEWVLTFMICSIGGGLIFFLLLIPFLSNIFDTFTSFLSVLSLNSKHATSQIPFVHYLQSLISFPGFLLIGVVLLAGRRKSWLAFVGFILASSACMNSIYTFRILYFMPFAVYGIVVFYGSMQMGRLRKMMLIYLAFVSVFFFGRSVVLRNSTEMFARSFRNYGVISALFRNLIGCGKSVYLDTFELGYISRDLGWTAYRLVNAMPTREILSRCDYVVVKEDGMEQSFRENIEKNGFSIVSRISNPDADISTVGKFLKSHGRLGALGPYLVFKRQS